MSKVKTLPKNFENSLVKLWTQQNYNRRQLKEKNNFQPQKDQKLYS